MPIDASWFGAIYSVFRLFSVHFLNIHVSLQFLSDLLHFLSAASSDTDSLSCCIPFCLVWQTSSCFILLNVVPLFMLTNEYTCK